MGKQITLNLSEDDRRKLFENSRNNGMAINKLIENFIKDLIDSMESKGSNERECANVWFLRCWFGTFPEGTLLNHLISNGYDPADYLEILENIDINKYMKTHPEIGAEEVITYLEDDTKERYEILESIRKGWQLEPGTNMEKEILIIKNWVNEREGLLCE